MAENDLINPKSYQIVIKSLNSVLLDANVRLWIDPHAMHDSTSHSRADKYALLAISVFNTGQSD